jgi:OmpA-OmpF porin, OOP family
MHRNKLPYFFLALAAVLAVTALILLIARSREKQIPVSTDAPVPVETQPLPEIGPAETPAIAPRDPETILKDVGVGLSSSDPSELVNRIAKALEAGDIAALSKLIGNDVLDPETAARLEALSAARLQLRQPDGVREVGELELNARTRWALELEGMRTRPRPHLPRPQAQRRQMVGRKNHPAARARRIHPQGRLADSLGVADAFLQAVLRQDFEFARDFVDPATVSDAKIAGLCILFEEGEYRMRKSKPLRAMFQREDTVGYLANVETGDGRQSAQFAITMKQPPAPANWLVPKSTSTNSSPTTPAASPAAMSITRRW